VTAAERAFFLPDGDDRFVATELTRGPWDPRFQHAGPPSGLLVRAVERCPSETPMQVVRIALDILRPVPIGPLTVAAEVARPGRNVELIDARLRDEDGVVVRASAWRIRRTELDIPRPDDGPSMPGPEQGERKPFFPTGIEVGYHTAMDWSFVSGGFQDQGPAEVWLRTTVALVAGEEPSPIQRVLIAADSGNGVSGALDYHRYLFINTDLVVSLHREPEGEWIGMDARTVPEPTGIGLAATILHDERGPIGRATQSLLVAERA
jgi:hypothetical protein